MVCRPWSQALLLLLETVDQQSSQIRSVCHLTIVNVAGRCHAAKSLQHLCGIDQSLHDAHRRLEEIIAADVCTTDINRPGVQHTPASLAVSFAHQLQGTKQQVAQLQDSCAVLSKQQEYGTNLTKETSVQFQQLQQRMQHLEQQQDIVQQQIGINSRPKGLRNHPPAAAPSGTSLPAVADLSHAATGLQQSAVALLPAAVSVATRLQQLEQQMSTLSESAAGIQVSQHASHKNLHWNCSSFVSNNCRCSLRTVVESCWHNMLTAAKLAAGMYASCGLSSESAG